MYLSRFFSLFCLIFNTVDAAKNCSWSHRTLHVVSSCPMSTDEKIMAEKIKKCEGLAGLQDCSESSSFKYHCVLNEAGDAFLEVCAPEVKILLGHCATFNTSNGRIETQFSRTCITGERNPCPLQYMSSESYQFPTCYGFFDNLTTYEKVTERSSIDPCLEEKKRLMIITVLLSVLSALYIITAPLVCCRERSLLCIGKCTDTPRKRRTPRDVGSRSPSESEKALHRELDTPSKRTEVLISQKEKGDHLVQSIMSVKSNIVEKVHLLPLENEEDTVNVLSLSLSPVQMAILAAAINHVPENFLDRNIIIMNICMASPAFDTLTPETVMQFIPVFQGCQSLMKFYKDNEQDISSILWQASWHHKEPFLAFINPPVTECLKCEETLYPIERNPITLYHLSGPIPGQSGVLKCKSCQICYHVDGYSVPNQGKSFYPAHITCPWKSASNGVFWNKDLHEFLCESSNHGFVTHQSFAEIFNSVYSDNHPKSEKFHAWRNYMLKVEKATQEASPCITSSSDENLTDNGNFDDCRIPESDTEAQPSHATADDDSSLQVNMMRKNATAVYFTGELENELQERDQVFFNIL